MNLKDFFSDYKKLIMYFGIISIILLVIPVIGFFSGIIFESLIVYLFIIVPFFGYCGGVWLWAVLIKSEKIKEFSSFIKIAGIFGTLALAGVLGFSFYMYFQPESVLRTSISFLNYLLLFMVFYLIGYDYSILKKDKPDKQEEKKTNDNIDSDTEKKSDINTNKNKDSKPLNSSLKGIKSLFIIDKTIIKNVGAAIIVILSLIFISLLSIGLYGNMWGIYGDVLSQMMHMFFIFSICIIGFGLAFIIWEHIKKSNLLTGDFKKILVILSLITTIVAIALLSYGVYSIYFSGTYTDLRNIVIMISLFIELMTFYFVGLLVSTLLLNKKKESN